MEMLMHQATGAPGEPTLESVMRLLADPTRRSLYERIVEEREITVSALADAAPVSQPAVSQHVRALRQAGLVTERRQGRNIFYSADPAGLAPLVDWLDVYGAFWRERITALRTLLQEIDPK